MTTTNNFQFHNVALYARANSEGALSRQVSHLEDLAASYGMTVSAVYTDVASGKVRNRPGLKRLLDDAKNGHLDAILTLDISRLFRGKEFLPDIHRQLMSGEIGLVTASGYLNPPRDTARLSLSILFHQFHVEDSARRIALGKGYTKDWDK
ncbi:Resolvase, N terminal domain [Paenibacillus sp. 1_12]|uniref:recombinase family protein n=1 Tax=Paenibacillus sp. 1_12 TaxID=1566278 RepID=UPI0008F05D8A|nr:recombinase family protein [Paenibacillus sp. 1_12]SFL20993.1 Resolvase, N terminal domain [Paenibacillus sp. 1_12]